MPGASAIVAAAPRRDPAVAAAGAVLGTSVYGRTGDSLVTLFGYGIEPEAQSLYQLERRPRTRARRHDSAASCSARPRRACSGPPSATRVTLVGRLDPQVVHRRGGPAAGGPRHGALALRLPRPAVGGHGAAGDAAPRSARPPPTAPR